MSMRSVVRGPKARRTHVAQVRTRSTFGKLTFDQTAQRRKRSTDTAKVKQKERTLRFECLLLSFVFIATPNSVRRQQREIIHHCSRRLNRSSYRARFFFFFFWGEARSKRHRLELTWSKHPVECKRGVISIVWHVDAVRPPRIKSLPNRRLS